MIPVEEIGRQQMGETVSASRPMTNADRIRAMSDEELARNFQEAETFGRAFGPYTSYDSWLDWLRQEVEDGS